MASSLQDGAVHSELLDAIRNQPIALVVGAGVSVASAGLPGWFKAIESAINHLATTETRSEEEIYALRHQLDKAASPDALTSCAEAVRVYLEGVGDGAGEFATWLKRAFDVDESGIKSTNLLRAIHRLPATVVTTTNYDKLLSMSRSAAEGVTWREPHRVSEALRSGKNVVHLHGSWDDPSSVILGRGDYDKLYREKSYRALVQTLWLSKTLIFVGCSLDGMRDPDFTRLLDWAANTFPNSTVKHYALVRSGTYSNDEADHFLNRWRIQLVPYGHEHDQLAPYLDALVPDRMTNVPPTPPTVFVGRDELVDQLETFIGEEKKILVHGMGGIGKTSLVSTAVSRLTRRAESPSAIWIDGVGKSVADLCRELGRSLSFYDIDLAPELAAPSLLTRHLSETQPVLTIVEVDNDIEAARSFVQGSLPNSSSAVVIARTRSIGFDEALEIPPLDETFAQELFCTITGIDDQQPQVAQICQLLEGHPLAITLAAARVFVESMPLAALLSRLRSAKHRLDTLRDTGQDDTRNTSVRVSLQISVEPLDDPLLRAITMASYLAADCTVELLARALNMDVIECEDLVGQLVSVSLLQRGRWGHIHLHPLVRAYLQDISRDHNDGFVRAVESVFIGLSDPHDGSGPEVGRIIVDNLDGVAAYILDTEPSDDADRHIAALRLTVSLLEPHGFLEAYGVDRFGHNDRRALIDHVELLVRDVPIPALKVMLYFCKASVCVTAQDFRGAITSLQTAVQLAEEDSDSTWLISSIKCELGNNLMRLGELTEAEQAMREGLHAARKFGDLGSIAQLTGQLGQIQLQQGDLEASQKSYLDAKSNYESVGDFGGVASCTYYLGEIALRKGDGATAWEFNVESLEAEIKADRVVGILTSLERLAQMVDSDDRLIFVLSTVDRIAETLPSATLNSHFAITHSVKGTAYFSSGRLVEAREHLLKAATIRTAASDDRGVAVVLGQLTRIELQESNLEAARNYNEESKAAYLRANDMNGVCKCAIDAAQIAIRAQLTDDAVEASREAIALAAMQGSAEQVIAAFQVLIHSTRLFPVISPPRTVLTERDVMAEIVRASADGDLQAIAGWVLSLIDARPPKNHSS